MADTTLGSSSDDLAVAKTVLDTAITTAAQADVATNDDVALAGYRNAANAAMAASQMAVAVTHRILDTNKSASALAAASLNMSKSAESSSHDAVVATTKQKAQDTAHAAISAAKTGIEYATQASLLPAPFNWKPLLFVTSGALMGVLAVSLYESTREKHFGGLASMHMDRQHAYARQMS